MDSVIDDIYGGKYKPKTNLKLGKVCKKGDEVCLKRRKTFFSTIAKMKQPTCPDGSFRGIPSQSLRNLVGEFNISGRKNQPKKILCKMLKGREEKIKKFGEYREEPYIGYNKEKGNFIMYPPNISGLPQLIEPEYRSYDYLFKIGQIRELPEWLIEDRSERKAYKAKGLKRPINIKRKRGRPAKVIEEVKEEVKEKKKRGRPPKTKVQPILQPIIKQPRKKGEPIILRF